MPQQRRSVLDFVDDHRFRVLLQQLFRRGKGRFGIAGRSRLRKEACGYIRRRLEVETFAKLL
jgi:hypothetical protein